MAHGLIQSLPLARPRFDQQAIQHQSKERLMQYLSQKLESSKSFCNTYRRTEWSILSIDKLKNGTGGLVLFSQLFQLIRFFKTFSQGYDFFVASHPPWAPLFAPSLRGRNNAVRPRCLRRRSLHHKGLRDHSLRLRQAIATHPVACSQFGFLFS